MLDAMLSAAQHLFSLGPLLGMLFVLPIALIAGIKPGGHLPVLAVLLSFAGYVDPWILAPTAVFYSSAVNIGEPIPSILLGIPGARSAQATVLDGYPMAQKGLAGVALGASYTCTLVGGVFGALVLLACLPFSFKLLLYFSSAEFFLLTLTGVMVIAVISSGAVAKGILTGALGIALAMVGVPTIGGRARATFGIDYLWDGLSLVPIVVGLFAVPEMIALVTGGKAIAGQRMDILLKGVQGDVYRGMREALKYRWLLLRSSIIGVIVGIVPGVGGQAGHWMSYAVARQTEVGARESFGTGDLRGVIASDAANNSSLGGELVPTLVLGIPGSGSMALLIGMLILGGIIPGPQMLKENLDLLVALVFVCILGATVTVPVMLALAPFFTRITILRPDILAPVVIALTSLGAFMSHCSMGDIAIAAVMGVLGLFMKRYGWPRPPILIAVALGEILEKYMVISLAAFGFKMLVRPTFLIVCAVMGLTILWGWRVQKRASTAKRETANMPAYQKLQRTVSSDYSPPSDRLPERKPVIAVTRNRYSLEFFGNVMLLVLTGAFFAYMFVDTLNMLLLAKLLPWFAIGVGMPFWFFRMVILITGKRETTPEAIMDTGFLTGINPKEELSGFIRISLFTAALYLGIWLFGFQVTVPLMVFFYLLKYGQAGWIWSAVAALAFAIVIIGVFDRLLLVAWHEPLLMQLLH